jgi:hypothetical protein
LRAPVVQQRELVLLQIGDRLAAVGFGDDTQLDQPGGHAQRGLRSRQAGAAKDRDSTHHRSQTMESTVLKQLGRTW